jgi:PAS domain S-box-containing protein
MTRANLRSPRARVFLMIVTVQFLLLVTATVAADLVIRRGVEGGLVGRAKLVGELLAAQARQDVARGDFDSLRRAARDMVGEGRLAFYALAGPQGDVLAASGVPEGLPLPPSAGAGPYSGASSYFRSSTAINPGAPAGLMLHVGLPTADAVALTEAVRVRAAPVILLPLLIATAITLWLVHRQLLDLVTIERVAARLSAGDYAARIARVSAPGFEPLARSLDGMAAAIGEKVAALSRSEAELGEQRALLRQVIDAVPNVIVLRDPQGRHVLCNRAFADLFGRSPEWIVGKREEDFARRAGETGLPPGGADGPGVAVADGADTEVVHEDREGRHRWFLYHRRMLVDVAGHGRVALAVGTDITAQKETEARMRDINGELERRVADRTAQLAASVKELESFSHTVSHDLRAPLRAIDGYAHIVQEESETLGPMSRERLARISREARHMAVLIDALLEFTHFSRCELRPQAVDMAAMARRIGEDLAPRGRHVEMHVGPMPAGRGDPALLRRLWGILLDNAMKYTRGRDPALIEAGARTGEGGTVYFVRDNGAGFDMQYAGKLFGMFSRLHAVGEFDGAGAGLALAQRILTRHGGRIWAESVPGEGATFHFTLGEPESRS